MNAVKIHIPVVKFVLMSWDLIAVNALMDTKM